MDETWDIESLARSTDRAVVKVPGARPLDHELIRRLQAGVLSDEDEAEVRWLVACDRDWSDAARQLKRESMICSESELLEEAALPPSDAVIDTVVREVLRKKGGLATAKAAMSMEIAEDVKRITVGSFVTAHPNEAQVDCDIRSAIFRILAEDENTANLATGPFETKDRDLDATSWRPSGAREGHQLHLSAASTTSAVLLSAFAVSSLWWLTLGCVATYLLQYNGLMQLDRQLLRSHGLEILNACSLVGLTIFGVGVVIEKGRICRRPAHPGDPLAGFFVGAALGLSMGLGVAIVLECLSFVTPIRPLGVANTPYLYILGVLLGSRFGLLGGRPFVRHVVGHDIVPMTIASNVSVTMLLALPLLFPDPPPSQEPLEQFASNLHWTVSVVMLIGFVPVVGVWRVTQNRPLTEVQLAGLALHLSVAVAVYLVGVAIGSLNWDVPHFQRWMFAAVSAGTSAIAIAYAIQNMWPFRKSDVRQGVIASTPYVWFLILLSLNAGWMLYAVVNTDDASKQSRVLASMWSLELMATFAFAWIRSLWKGLTWFTRR